MAEEDISHLSVMWNGKVLLVHGPETTKDSINNTKGRFQVQASLVVRRACDGVSGRDGLEHCFVRFVTGAFLLGREVEEALDSNLKVSLVSELGNNHSASN